MPVKEMISETLPLFRSEMLQFCVLSYSCHSCLLEGHERALWLVLRGVLGFSCDPSSALSLAASEAGQLWRCLLGEALGQQPAGAGAWGLPDTLVWDSQEVAMEEPQLLSGGVGGKGGPARPGLCTCPPP